MAAGYSAGLGRANVPASAATSSVPQLLLNAWFLSSEVLRLCHAMVGTIASTR
ncbi:MAG: hypothetical protein JWR78_3304 [Mycobacterium sp.]|nr:hypothetical protein [Mycobacterium sp.]